MELKCPYCEQECDPDIYDKVDSNTQYEHECEHCGKSFLYEIEYFPTYESKKADCLNAKDHDWGGLYSQPDRQHPYYPHAKKCKICGKIEWGKYRE